MSESKDPPKRVFTEEFKRDAVRLAVERGNVCVTARDLGIHETILGRWKRAIEKEATAPSTSPVYVARFVSSFFLSPGKPSSDHVSRKRA